jgi:hypothetical protein
MSTPFKSLKADCIQAFLDAIQETRGIVPEEFAETWLGQKWKTVQAHARGAIAEVLAKALRDVARSKCTEAICEQLNLPGEYFENLPVAVPTENDGYCGAGLATVEDWARSIAEHDKQIAGHEASKDRINKHIAKRRELGIADDMGWYEKKR